MTTMKHEAATDVATFAPSNKETLPETKALLNQVVADLYVAHIALHQVHWYMRGRGFMVWHPKMDEYMDSLDATLDEVSERLITLGGAPYSSMTEFLEHSNIEERRGTFTKNVEESLTRVLEIFHYLDGLYQKALDVTDAEGDDVTNDIFVGAKAELEKQRDETKVALTNQKQAESALQEKIRQQNDLIAKTKNDEAEYTKYASERSSQKAELQKQQQDMIQAQILRAARAAGGGAIPQAIAGTSSYPWNDANCYVDGNAVSHGGADGNGGDGYGYGCRQCVSYVAWKLRATKGINAAYWGNAKNVPASARNAGFRTGSTPKAGSFGVMTGGQYGHIVWVESVNGNMVTISQYNYLVNGKWGQFSTMTVPASTYDTYVYFD